MDNIDDDIRNNVRKRLDITKATNYRLEWLVFSLNANIVSILRKGRNNSVVSIKQLSSQTGTSLPSNKQACLISSTKADSDVLSNRKYRRIILRNFKEFIYKTSFRTSLFAVLEGCIEGYKFLYTAGFFYKDISINNLIINKDDDNLSLPLFLIDLDLVIRVQREDTSRAKRKTSTKAFIAIGALLDEQHLFIHDLESFF